MTWDGRPWFVDGAEHGPEVARVLGYLASGGHGGIVGAIDCKVTASEIPDGNVHIAPGAIVALNRGEGGGSQAYVGQNIGDEVKGLTAQGASGVRYDLVAYVVEDPQYAGQPEPADEAMGPYDRTRVYEGVPATTLFLSDIDPDQTGEALALVKFDASDGTINAADITDLRRLVLERSKTVERMTTVDVATPTNMSTAAPTTYPTGASWTIPVPSWANRVALSAVVSGVDLLDSGSDNGNASGTVHVELGALATPMGRWRADSTGLGKRTTTMFQAAEDNIKVPAAMRGQTAVLRVRAAKTGGAGLTARSADGTTAVVRAVFSEQAD